MTQPSVFVHWAAKSGHMMRAWAEDVIVLIVLYGQSFEGFTNNLWESEEVVHPQPVHPGHLLMPSCGLRVQGRAFDVFVDLHEQKFSEPDRPWSSESYCTEFGNYVLNAMQAQHGFKRRLAMLSVNRGDRDWTHFAVGSPKWFELTAAISNAQRAAAARGARLVVGGVLSAQGARDAKIGVRLEERIQRNARWQLEIDAACRQITGQSDMTPLVIMGPDRAYRSAFRPPEIELAAVESARRSPGRIIYAGPGYPHRGDKHYRNEGYQTAGLTYAMAWTSGYLGGGAHPLTADYHEWLDLRRVRIVMDMPVGRSLVLDDERTDGAGTPVTAAGLEVTKGFGGRDATDDYAADAPIERVAVADSRYAGGADQAIVVTFGRDMDRETARLFYAWRRTGLVSEDVKARGLVRDDFAGPTGTGLTYPVHNWLAPFCLHAHKRF